MGFCQSKEAVSGGDAAPRDTGPKSGTMEFGFAPGVLVQKVEELFSGQSSDEAADKKKPAGKKGPAHHLRNIFVAPLENVVGYTPPSFPKSPADDELIRKALKANFVFKSLAGKDLDTLVGAFEEIKKPEGEAIITQGEVGDYFYVVKSGTVKFEVSGRGVGEAKKGDAFGELALLYSAPRAASVVVVTAAELFRVDQKTFRMILQNSGQKEGKDRLEMVKKVEFFSQLDEADQIKMTKIMKPRPFKEGDYLCRKGEDAEGMVIVQYGKLKGTDIEIGGRKYDDVLLGPGDNVGAKWLVEDLPLQGNLIALNSGMAMIVDKKDFRKTMGNYKQLSTRVADKRLLSLVPVISKTYLEPEELSTLAARMTEKLVFKDEVIIKSGKINSAALFFVREGSVKVHEPGKGDRVIEKDGFFGEDSLLRDVTSGAESDPVVQPKYSVIALESCKLGVLTLAECRTVFDTTTMGKGKTGEAAFEAKIELDDLEKHKILGAGTFGQVWLVSSTDSSAKKHPYALKIQIKHELIENGQAGGVVREKNVMARLRHPFIMKLVKTFQDPDRIYMLFGLLQGGELHSVFYEREYREGLPEKKAKFYMAGLVEGLSYMHSRHVIHRDLKPENVMINEKGYPVLIDFGFAKVVTDKTYTFCGTPLYIAPEILLNKGHDRGADHWSLGCMIYESMTGENPFYIDGMDQLALFKAIVAGDFDFPRKPMSNEAKTIVLDFLDTDPSYRLGSLAGGLKDIYQHPWFSDISFVKLRKQEIKAPWVPVIKDPLSASNFTTNYKMKDKSKEKCPKLTAKQQKLFETF